MPSTRYSVEEGVEFDTENGPAREKPKLGPKQSSVLDRHDDPFATREGKTLVWRNIQMTLVSASEQSLNVFHIVRRLTSWHDLFVRRMPRAMNRNASCFRMCGERFLRKRQPP